MQKKIVVAVAAGTLLASFNAVAEDGNWMMRVRAVYIDWVQESSPVGQLGLPANDIHLEKKWAPEVDFTYFFTKNLAAELILTYPQKHTVRVQSLASDVGSLHELPPSLILQYHFTPEAQYRPYVGAGFNYTTYSRVDLAPLNGVVNTALGGTHNASVDRTNLGGVLQAGMDFKVGANSYINLDVKKVYIQSDLYLDGAKISTIKGDPVLWGIGYGFRF
jgi:outer membrane protein